MTNEELLKKYIISKYGSVNSFCISNDIPYTTVVNIFNRGMSGTSIGVLTKICKALGISLEKLIEGKIERRIMDIHEVSQFDLLILTAYHESDYQSAVNKLLNIEPELPTSIANHEENESESE